LPAWNKLARFYADTEGLKWLRLRSAAIRDGQVGTTWFAAGDL
jgi:hypothetical protein